MPGIFAPLLEPEAFSQLYERNNVLVFRYIFGLHGGPVEDVEDLTAETFFKAWKARRRFSGSDVAATGWLLHIARNLVIDRYRREQVRQEQSIDELQSDWFELPDRAFSPEQLVEFQQQFNVLWKMIRRLPVEQKELLVLRYILGWKVNQIAVLLEMPENTISVKLRRILEQVRDNWPDDQE